MLKVLCDVVYNPFPVDVPIACFHLKTYKNTFFCKTEVLVPKPLTLIWPYYSHETCLLGNSIIHGNYLEQSKNSTPILQNEPYK